MTWFACSVALVAATYGFSATLNTRPASARELIAVPAASESVQVEPDGWADRLVWKRITLARYPGVRALREALEAAHVRVGDLADEVLGRPAFGFSAIPLAVDLVVLTPKDLGFAREAAQTDIDRRAVQLGLELCPAEVGPLLRLAYLDQPAGEFLRIAMNPVLTWGGTPVILTVANGGTGPLLIGGESRPDLRFAPASRFVFARPQRIASPER